MRRISLKFGELALVCGVLGGVWPTECPAQQRHPTDRYRRAAAAAEKPSLTESMASSVKRGFGKFGEMVTPDTPVKSAPDAISLDTKPNPSVKSYIAMARYHEERGLLSKAAQIYEKALRVSPNHLGAMLEYARLKDRLDRPEEAARLYRRAAKIYPKEPSVFNNMGAFHGRRGMMKEAVSAMQKAVTLRPSEAKYRNNLAVMLVEMGRNDEALGQLQAVSSKQVAHYNLGFLLSKKGHTAEAARHFAMAVRIDPSMVQAREMLQRMAASRQRSVATARGNPGSRPPAGPSSNVGPRLGSRPTRAVLPPPVTAPPRQPSRSEVRQLPPPPKSPHGAPRAVGPRVGNLPPRPDSSVPRRLPPISSQPAVAPPSPPLPGGSVRRPSQTPVAPVPARSGQGPAITPLPRVN